ncbi:uncharacterized protein B0I36DRAFT_251908 [Microdochium trichocladiopsis]|uniref:Zn(2)-C6 fungal-type domain-containing protein n=1 Tax=Microdochium trichocladiopsis TaxID=1682393 RepID=A0A9P9BKQ8_9PEZI|nr:uncharacterized protein B0I36DRAFT_251908 [Microdochium trichocladiopsis]KAH7021461.1 hypothetical protein B0I36DRAFT_251908 [Microdochium trichocladiopsis]
METRPYRSHKVRACDLCRKHKTGCVVDIPGLGCRRCRSRDMSCLHAIRASTTAREGPAPPSSTGRSLPRLQSRRRAAVRDLASHGGLAEISNVRPTALSPHDGSSSLPVHVLGPSGAQDSQVIEEHLLSARASPIAQEHIGICSTDRKKPVGFTYQLFLKKVNMAFPIISSDYLFAPTTSTVDHGASDVLLCTAYASALMYWKHAPGLAGFPCPDHAMVQALAAGAVQEAFAAPQLSTVMASLVLLGQRPVDSATSNAMTLGQVVSLSHCLGLNRYPSTWSIPDAERSTRTALWWGLRVHDTWSALARGIPPLTQASQTDVPMLTMNVLDQVDAEECGDHEPLASECFMLLCRLTTTTQGLRCIAFDLRGAATSDSVTKGLRQRQVELDQWEELYAQWRTRCEARPGRPRVPGLSHLALCFLTTKMLVHRMMLHESVKSDETPSDAARRFHQLNCQKAAHDIVEFVSGLDEHDFADFWLPYTSSHLTVCATLLLRCALEAEECEVSQACMEDLERLQTSLRAAEKQHGWELGQACLSRCQALVPHLRHGAAGARRARSDKEVQDLFSNLVVDADQVDMGLFDVDLWLSTASMGDMLGDVALLS